MMLNWLKVGQRAGLVCLLALSLAVTACGEDESNDSNNTAENNSTENNSTENNSTENNSTENNSTENNSTENNSSENNNAQPGDDTLLSEMTLDDACQTFGEASMMMYSESDDAIEGLCKMAGGLAGASAEGDAIAVCEADYESCMTEDEDGEGYSECMTEEVHQACNITEAEMIECLEKQMVISTAYWVEYADSTCEELTTEEMAAQIADDFESSYDEVLDECAEIVEKCPGLF